MPQQGRLGQRPQVATHPAMWPLLTWYILMAAYPCPESEGDLSRLGLAACHHGGATGKILISQTIGVFCKNWHLCFWSSKFPLLSQESPKSGPGGGVGGWGLGVGLVEQPCCQKEVGDGAVMTPSQVQPDDK